MNILIASLMTLLLSGNSFYNFKVKALDGKEIDFASFKGKKVLIVNTASECGYTPQYADLQKLYDKHQGKLVVIGFPANDFGGQEPGTNQNIEEFCKKNFGVTFPMAEKVTVKGDGIHPLFAYLTEEAKKLNAPEPVIKWNFTKFLINEKGELVKVFASKVNPMSEELDGYLK